MKPKLELISQKSKQCKITDEEAKKQIKELQELLKKKDELCKDGYIKKEDHETQISDINSKLDEALVTLQALISSSTTGNEEITNMVEDIEEQLSNIDKELKENISPDSSSGVDGEEEEEKPRIETPSTDESTGIEDITLGGKKKSRRRSLKKLRAKKSKRRKRKQADK